jgi:hypothetical protein
MRRQPVSLAGRHCQCGAAAEKGSKSCQKCRRRTQWLRRKRRTAIAIPGYRNLREGS